MALVLTLRQQEVDGHPSQRGLGGLQKEVPVLQRVIHGGQRGRLEVGLELVLSSGLGAVRDGGEECL